MNMWKIALHASLADQIIFLDGAGSVETKPIPKGLPPSDPTILAMLQSSGPEPLEMAEKAESRHDMSVQDKAKKQAAIEAQEERTLRRRGNKMLYYFYFRSIKAWVATFWLFLLIFSTISGELPGKRWNKIHYITILTFLNRNICSNLARGRSQ